MLTLPHVHHTHGIDTLEGGPNRDWFLARPAPAGGDRIEGMSDGKKVTGI